MPAASSSRLTSPERRDLTSIGLALATGLLVSATAPLWLGVALSIVAFMIVSLAT